MSHRIGYMYGIVAAVLWSLSVSVPVAGQWKTPSFDESIRYMAGNAAGRVRYSADDYLQYSPAVVMLGMKAFGYESRSSWGRMLVSDAISAAAMTGAVYALKYSVSRPRPDGSSYDSFPSGHAAKSFMAAAMLHEEYGWRSPWISFTGYALASATGISRIINDRHWATDVIAGAVIGVASVSLGYFLADMIFMDRYLNSAYDCPVPGLDGGRMYYDIGLYSGYRFFLGRTVIQGTGRGGDFVLKTGGTSGLEMSVPLSNAGQVRGTAGIACRIGANSFCIDNARSFNTYDFMIGGYWRTPLAKVLEADARILAGYSLSGNRAVSGPAGIRSGPAAAADCGLAVVTGENFKIKAFAAYEISRFTVQKPFVQSVVLGGSASFFWH